MQISTDSRHGNLWIIFFAPLARASCANFLVDNYVHKHLYIVFLLTKCHTYCIISLHSPLIVVSLKHTPTGHIN